MKKEYIDTFKLNFDYHSLILEKNHQSERHLIS